MASTGYRVGEPNTGDTVDACRSKKALKDIGGGTSHLDAYEVTGDLIEDTGGKDGLRIKVKSYRKIRI